MTNFYICYSPEMSLSTCSESDNFDSFATNGNSSLQVKSQSASQVSSVSTSCTSL